MFENIYCYDSESDKIAKGLAKLLVGARFTDYQRGGAMNSQAKVRTTLASIMATVLFFALVPSHLLAQQEIADVGVGHLINELDSDDFSDREDAMNALVRRGAEVIAPVAIATDTGNVEVRSRGLQVLYSIATRFRGDLATEEAAIKALEALSRSDNRQLAFAANRELEDARKYRHEEAYAQLKKLGAEFAMRTTKGRTVRFKEEWTGTTEDLWRLKRLNRLEAVEFLGPTVSNETVVCLDGLPKLLRVYFGSGTVDGKGLRQALTYPSLSEVETLLLMEPNFTNDDIENISELKKLKWLWLSNSQIDDGGLLHLKEARSIEKIVLGGNKIDGTGFQHLTNLPNFNYFSLSHAIFDDRGAEHLGQLKTVVTLGLEHTQVTDAGIAQLQPMTGLKYLFLTDTRITDGGIEELAKLKTLEKLYLRDTKVTIEGVARLKKLLPSCRIYADAK